MKKAIYRILFGLMLATMAFAAVPPDQTSGQSGESSTVDDPQVLSLLKEANQGSAGAQFLLGFFYAEGQGVAKNEQEAIKWYTLAAEQGHADAIVTLGMMYSEGRCQAGFAGSRSLVYAGGRAGQCGCSAYFG
jgi:TPR repeat protein